MDQSSDVTRLMRDDAQQALLIAGNGIVHPLVAFCVQVQIGFDDEPAAIVPLFVLDIGNGGGVRNEPVVRPSFCDPLDCVELVSALCSGGRTSG